MRKPRRLDRGITKRRTPYRVAIYADFDDTKDCCIYIGGSYYQDSAQIHLNEKEVHALAKYLSNASAYLKQKKA